MKKLPCIVATLAIPGWGLAMPTLQFDFNGMPVGRLGGLQDDSPNTIGPWAGQSAVPQVVVGDLSAPAATNYAFGANGVTRHALVTRADDAYRGQFQRVVPVGGVMWLSFLVRAAGESAAAVVFDGADTSNLEGWSLQNKPGLGIRPGAGGSGTELFWSENLIDLSANQSAQLAEDFSDRTVLLLARIEFAGAGDNVQAWVNPVLTTPGALGPADLLARTSRSAIEWVGLGAVRTDLPGYRVEFDNILLSNDPFEPAAFAAVTGLPAPPPPPPAPEVIAPVFDFDDLPIGPLGGLPDDSPDAPGAWTGESRITNVVLGSLPVPQGTGLMIPADGIGGRALISGVAGTAPAQFHRITPGAGVMWFSVVLHAGPGVSAAVAIEGGESERDLAGKAGFGIRPMDAEVELFWSDDLGDSAGRQGVGLAGMHANRSTLVVGRIAFEEEGGVVDLWLNPSLADRAGLGATGDLRAHTHRSRMDWIGIGVAGDGGANYAASFDHLRFANDPDEDLSFRLVTGVLPAPVFGAADLNGNGLPDLAELREPRLAGLAPSGDEDLDGASNLEEALAGTDPFDHRSRLQGLSMVRSAGVAGRFEFTFQSVPGRRYAIEVSDDLERWTEVDVTGEVSSDSVLVLLDAATLPDRAQSFVRVRVLPPVDTDHDGLEDGLERYLGFDPQEPASVRSRSQGGDLRQFERLLTGGAVHGGVAGSSSAGVPSDEQASRFLAQASFGPTPGGITALRSLGPDAYGKWIDLQLRTPPSFLRSYIDLLVARMESDSRASDFTIFPHFVTEQTSFAMFRENVNTAWMRQALFAPDELRQRMAWALSQVVVVGPRCNSYGIAAADWYDTVIRHSLGNYRDLLHDIAVHPWMGWYLSHLGNRKADPAINRMPDENFAREIMQLFSIGIWQLHMDGTRVLDADGEPILAYTNDDIVQLARVFTGLELQVGTSGQEAYAVAPMRMLIDRHDVGDAVSEAVYGAREKIFLGASLPSFADDPGRTGLDDVADAIEVLVNHPNCPPFISKNLIQHLVTSNPSPAYVERVARVFADDGTGVRGNLAATVKAILLDPEARDLAAALHPESGRLKGPMLRTVGVARAFHAGAATPALHDLSGIQFWSPRKHVMFGDFLEYPFEYPSVFNFYEPGYSRPGEVLDKGLLSPEFQIMNPLTATTVPNRLWWFVRNGFHDGNRSVTPSFRLELAPLRALSTDTELLLDRMNLLLCHGSLGAEGRASMRRTIDFWNPTDANWKERLDLAVYLALVSPDSAVLK